MTIGLITRGYIPDPDASGFTPPVTIGVGVEKIHNAIRCRIEDILRPLIDNCPVQHDNAPFTKPDKTCWLRATVILNDAKQVDTGGVRRRYRNKGLLIFSIFTPLALGDQEGNSIADQVTLVFRGINTEGVIFKTPSTKARIRQTDEWMINVECPFFADQLG